MTPTYLRIIFLAGSLLLFGYTAYPQTTPNWTEQAPANSPPARDAYAIAYDSVRGQVVLFGGENGLGTGDFTNDTWVWDGINWRQRFPQNSPPARAGHSMVFDAARGQVVLFGGDGLGLGISPLNDTWVWDGSDWTQKFPATSPSPRTGLRLSYDSAHGQTVLFGGASGPSSRFADTWIWDGSNWTQMFPATSPSARAGHAMTYDAARSEVLMFGGAMVGGTALDDTWVWDGTDWTEKFPQTSPPGRFDTSLAYDIDLSEAVVFGGLLDSGGPNVAPTYAGDTWVWDGNTWTELFPLNEPAPTFDVAMDYDSRHGQIVAALWYALPNLTTWTLSAATAGPPTINSVISASAFGAFSFVAPGGWVEIYGSNLAPDTREWANSDFNGSNAPTSLDGVQVMIGGQQAFVEYISTTGQINAQLPSNISAGGALAVTVTNGSQTSSPFNVNVSSTAPGLLAPPSFLIGGKQYAVAILGDGSYVLPNGAIPGVTSRPARPGETIILFGTGFGPVTPPLPAGQIETEINTLTTPLQIFFGQTSAQIQYDGLTPSNVGLYQFNLVVPAVPDNLLVPITFDLGGVAGTQTLYLAVGQ